MEQKMRAPKLSIWFLAIFAGVVASTHASAINLNRSTYKGCISECSPKDNSIYGSSTTSSSRLSSLWRKSQGTPEGSQSLVHFELGKTYTYRVLAWNEARTLFASGGDEGTTEQLVGVEATAWITPVSDCELSMQLKNITLDEDGDQKQFEGQEDVQAFIRQLEVPILFGYTNGVVFEVCTDVQEDDFVLNIKKSIISALQTTPKLDNTKVIEADLNGECETQYTVEKQSGGKYIILKEKDLNRCENAAEQQSTYSNWKNTLLKHNADSMATCKQIIDSRQIKSSQCQSVRSLNTVLPHFVLELVSTVEIEAENVFAATEEQSAQVPQKWTRHAGHLMMSTPAGFFGKKSHQVKEEAERFSQLADGRVQLKNVLDQICDDIKTHGQRVTTQTAHFVQLLADTLKRSSREDVDFVWKNIVQNGNICGQQAKKMKDIFVDTAASVMNRNAATIVRDELSAHIERAQQHQDQTALKRARFLATVIAFSFEPTAEAVREIVPELLEKVEDSHIILSLTALLKKTQNELKDGRFVESLYEMVLRKITARLVNVHEKEADIVRLLTALQNLDARTMVAGQERLGKMITDKRMPESIRIAAIKSLAHIQMQPQLRQTMLASFADRTEKNEVRIAAYRTIVYSAVTVEELSQLHKVIEQEENQDVHNYVCSHQKNLRTTDDLAKRALLPLEAPLFPEPQSAGNFWLSRNFEYTTVNAKTQVGAIVEADLIMEQDSRVPRAVSFNLTVPVAEQQIPIVEVTIRQEGLEKSLLERLEKIKQIKSPAHALRELSKMVRSAKHHQKEQYRQEKQGKMQIYLNVDGKNVYIWDSVECQKEHPYDQFETVLAQLYKRLPVQIDETMVMMPLKHRVRLPTASGIPINFELNTTLIASLESSIKGHQGVESLLEAHIKPTFVVEVGVGLEADLHFQGRPNQRVQFVNRFISSPTFHVKTSFKSDSRQISVKVLMPESEQIIARFETEYNNRRDNQVLLNALKPTLQRQMRKALNKQHEHLWYRKGSQSGEQCMPALDQLFGFTYCVQHFTDNDLKHSLASRTAEKVIFRSQVKLVKTDRDMEGIEFGLQLPELFTPEATADEFKFVFHFDTPNSSTNRRITTELIARIPQESNDKFLVRLDIDSPLKKLSGQMLLLNGDTQKGLKIELATDRAQRQFLLETNAIFNVQDANNQQVKLQFRFQPTAESRVTELEGQLIVAKSENKRKAQMTLKSNEKQIFDMEFVQAGSFRKPIDCKASFTFQFDILGAQVQYSSVFNKNAQTGTFKSTGTLKYNHFLSFSRRSRSTIETIEYQFQLSGLNADESELKDFLHWFFKSSQFPQVNHELTYNIKGKYVGESNSELNFKWSQEEKRVRIVTETKKLQNARSRSLKYQAVVEIEVTPINFHHDVKLIIELPSEEQQQQMQNFGVELKAQNRKTGEITVEAQWVSRGTRKQPVKIEAQGQIKLRNGKYVYLFSSNLEEVRHHELKGMTIIEVPQGAQKIFPWMWNKMQNSYTIKFRDTPARRVPEIEGRLRHLWNVYAKLINSIDHFEQEVSIEGGAYGLIHQTSQLTCNEQDLCLTKWQLERDQRIIYKGETETDRREMTLKVKFECDYINQLAIQMETQLKEELKRCNLKVQTARFQHQTRILADKREQKYELACQTKKGQEVIFELDGKKINKDVHLKVQSQMIDAEIELDNVQPRLIRSMLKKRSLEGQQEEECQAKIAIKLPRYQLEHKTDIKVQPAQRQLAINSETRKEERNLAKVKLHLQPEEKTLLAEYYNGYIADLKLTRNAQKEYELVADYRIEPKQWFHKTMAKWQWNRRAESRVGSYALPYFRLISLEMKNHLGQKNVFDLTYRCNEQNPAAEYAHEYILSTRDSHVELYLSRFGFDWNNQKYQPKGLFNLKTKKFGGIEHKTELKQVDIEKRQLKINSKTIHRDEVIVQVECELALQRGQQSHVKVLASGHQIDMQFVPFEWFEIQADYRGIWKHHGRFDRKAAQQQWNLKLESSNQRLNEQWNAHLWHQCDQHTTLELETPIVRGNVEVRLDSKKIRIDLKGGKKWTGMEHKLEAQWDKEAKKVVLKSVTLKQSKPFAFVDAEIYASLHRPSTLKVELEPAQFKLHIQVDPKAACELTVVAKNWKHTMQIKKRSAELMLQTETRKDGEIVAAFETELSPAKWQFKCELGLKQFSPVSVKGKFDLEDREMHLQAHHHQSDRLIKLEAKMKDLKNVHIECSWDAKRDQAKKVLIQVRVQDKQSAPERFVASVRGELIDRPFEVQIDVPRRASELPRASFNVEANLKNRQTGQQFVARYTRKVQHGEQCDSQIELRKNDFTYIKADIKANYGQENKKAIILKVESDLKVDVLNVDLQLTRECAYKQCQTKVVAKYGAQEKKEIKFEGANVADALRGQLMMTTPQMNQQTIKFEFIKPESKLQINVFNQAGRQLDINVDLARPLQKKFQIVSFISSIPTIDIEAAHGENSRLVIQVSFQEEKKMELSLNWFGQWRRDFKLEALFKCFSRPSIEMLVTSRHPAGVDEIDAMLKIAAKEYIAKWSRSFDENKQNWNTKTLIKVNGEKKVDLVVECITKQEQADREVKTFKAVLDGVRRATGHLTVHFRKPTSSRMIEMIQCELGNDHQPRQVAFELYFAARNEQQSTITTGVKLTAQDKPIFGLVHLTGKRQHGQNKRTSMIRLELPDEIEYVLRNEIEYEQSRREQIKSIRSELKKKSISIYQTRIAFGEDMEHDMKVMRIEVYSTRFAAPKLIQIRYNFQPKQCKSLEHAHQQQRTFAYGETKCWRMELLAGKVSKNQEQPQPSEADQEFDIKIGAEYLKHPIDSGHFNQTIRFTLEAQPQSHKLQQRPINFQLTGHLSHRSFGMIWKNRNRHGEHKHGMIYVDAQPIDSKHTMMNMYMRNQNKEQSAKDIAWEMHVSPQAIRRTMRMSAKWDQERVRRWIVGELPRVQEMARKENLRHMPSRIVRAIKEEAAHKISYMKENYNNELVEPIMEECREVQRQLQDSEEVITREIVKAVKRVAEKAAEVYDHAELEQSLDEFAQVVVDSWKAVEGQFFESLAENCQRSQACRKMINYIRDYEIQQFIQENIQKAEEMSRKLKRAVPEDLLESIKQLAYEFSEAHDEEQQWNVQGQEGKSSRRYMKHGARLLKMAQPEMTETMMKHYHKISKHFDNDDDQFQGQQQQQQINWAEVRGAVHDMAVDMIDTLQKKTQQVEKKPFWNQFYSGNAQGSGDYSKYASKWNQPKNQSKKYNQDDEDQQQNETSSKNNFVFSPKRGEFKLFEATSSQSTSPYWSRA